MLILFHGLDYFFQNMNESLRVGIAGAGAFLTENIKNIFFYFYKKRLKKMFDYYNVMMISTIIISCSWIFATIHRIWEECFAGYLIVTVFMLVLRTFNFNIIISWNEFYLYIVKFYKYINSSILFGYDI